MAVMHLALVSYVVVVVGVCLFSVPHVVEAHHLSQYGYGQPGPVPSTVTLPPASPEACQPEEGVWRPGSTYNDPSLLITFSPVECCDICRGDSRCVTWSRKRSSGACALKDSAAAAFRDAAYDSGVIEGTDAQSVAPLGRCFTQNGVAYFGGSVVFRGGTGSANQCCELCRGRQDCFSWHRNSRNGNCILNGNIPGRSSHGNFQGAAMI